MKDRSTNPVGSENPVQQRILAPEIIQTSAMDCGPAALACLLQGFGVPVNYARLREACQTDVDGTSIDTIEDVANQLGLIAEQIIIPVDHVLVPAAQALPALAIVRQPNGLTHFVVLWSQIGGLVQVMDPASGRRWITPSRLLDELYLHTATVTAAEWREWAGSEGFLSPLRERLIRLGVEETVIAALIEGAVADPGWRGLATLDAATRMVTTMSASGGVERGIEASNLLQRLCVGQGRSADLIPATFWLVQPGPVADEELVQFRGAVLVRIAGRRSDETIEPPAALAQVMREPAPQPERAALQMLWRDSGLSMAIALLSIAMISGGLVIEALLLRGLIDTDLNLSAEQRTIIAGALIVFAVVMLLLELPIATLITRSGRRLETRLRIALLRKIPRLGDNYFHSRLVSDMTQRAHDLRQLRLLPGLIATGVRQICQITLTMIGLIWFAPASAIPAALSAASALGLALLSQPVLAETDLRLRTHIGGLSRYYLDALLGLTPLRAHRAETSLRREHESLLVEWARASRDVHRLSLWLQAIGALLGVGFTGLILYSFLSAGGDGGSALLLLYWAMNLPMLGHSLALTLQQYPPLRSRLARLLEPLGAPESAETAPISRTPELTGCAITFTEVDVIAGGRSILHNINLDIRAGEHIAIVGPSGAGKSSLVSVLLGLRQPARGMVQIDGVLLTDQLLPSVLAATVWVDPTVQIWNRSLLSNLCYGTTDQGTSECVFDSHTLSEADLFETIARLPDGLQTPLGEGGGLVAGGEGQRVRLGRAFQRQHPRLAILDEPFRGLQREQRAILLGRARQRWRQATLICVTHDIAETQTFDRVLVMEQGRIVEDGAPAELAAQPSRYRELLIAEQELRHLLWNDTNWKRWRMRDGQIEVL